MYGKASGSSRRVAQPQANLRQPMVVIPLCCRRPSTADANSPAPATAPAFAAPHAVAAAAAKALAAERTPLRAAAAGAPDAAEPGRRTPPDAPDAHPKHGACTTCEFRFTTSM
jgi:hypothetical protein